MNDEFRGKRVPSERSADIHFWGDPDCPNSRQRVRQIVIGTGREVKGENRETRE